MCTWAVSGWVSESSGPWSQLSDVSGPTCAAVLSSAALGLPVCLRVSTQALKDSTLPHLSPHAHPSFLLVSASWT